MINNDREFDLITSFHVSSRRHVRLLECMDFHCNPLRTDVCCRSGDDGHKC